MGRRQSPEQLAAYQAVQGALRRGELARPKRCPRCSRRCVVQAHHADHSKPLEVSWECSSCHGKGRRAVLMHYQVPHEVKAKCKREGVSIRALILQLLKAWAEDRQ